MINLRLIMIAAAVISILSAVAYIYHRGGSDREDKIIADAMIESIKERDKLDEIRDAAIDLPIVLERVQDRSY